MEDTALTTTSTPTPTLCLNMIVKNESKIIERMLASVVGIIDCYCICDTGSTDGTVDTILRFFREKHPSIQGKIIYEPFQNFAHNRNVALRACEGMSDFILLMDADMVLTYAQQGASAFHKCDLIKYPNIRAFSILQGHDGFYYGNVRIICNNNKEYKYVGVTHEYLDLPMGEKSLSLNKETIFIVDLGDGGSKDDKYERDIRLLTEGICKEPDNARYYFYLANSYFDLGRFQEAVPYYEKRIKMGGWIEETWYSIYRKGLCFKGMDNMAQAIVCWLDGFDLHPRRLEGMYEIIKHCRIRGQKRIAWQFVQMCIPYLADDERSVRERNTCLFLNAHIYTYLLWFEFSILGAYNGVLNFNDVVIRIFNACPIADIFTIFTLLSNMKYYRNILVAKTTHIADNNMTFMFLSDSTEKDTRTLYSSSSCLLPVLRSEHNDKELGTNATDARVKYLMNVRYVNYWIEPNGHYRNCDDYIISANQCLELDENFQLVNSYVLNVPFDGRKYVGMEDVRIYWHNAETRSYPKLIFMANGLQQNGQIGLFSGDYVYKRVSSTIEVANRDVYCSLRGVEWKQTFAETVCEKNWVLTEYGGSTCVIYKWFPLTICEIKNNQLEENMDANTIEIVEIKQMPNLFHWVRGSSCGFSYGGELWFVVHIVSHEQPRHYYHLIVVLDGELNLKRYTAPFQFEGCPIEYCLSIVVENERVIMNYSTWDRTTRLAVYDKSYIDNLLTYKQNT